MKIRKKLVLTALAAVSLAAIAANTALAPDTPVIVDGNVTVDAGDIDGYLLRVPAERRPEMRASKDRVAAIADNVFIARTLAMRAREIGLDKDPAVQRRLRQVQDGFLSDLYVQHLEKEAVGVNLEQRARELYLGDPARFKVPEQVHVQHILVGLRGRTREMAEERAKKVHEELKSGKEDFLALAARLSDDTSKNKNGGDLGYSGPRSFVEPVAERIAKMHTKGEISEPVESHLGFHIIKFIDRQYERTMTFDEVKKDLMAQERDRLQKKRIEELVTQIRSSSTVVVHLDKLDALVLPVDDILRKAQEELARASAEPKKANRER